MTKMILLEQLREFTEVATRDIIMPTSKQKDDTEPDKRTAKVFLMRLPDSHSARKKAPYILHQLITSKDMQTAAQGGSSDAVVRSLFCVYHDDEQEGAKMLLNLMERLRITLLMNVIIGKQFQLDLEAGLECLIYPDDTAPYYSGEMVSTWQLPVVEREVRKWL